MRPTPTDRDRGIMKKLVNWKLTSKILISWSSTNSRSERQTREEKVNQLKNIIWEAVMKVWMLRTQGTVQYFRSVHTELWTTRRLNFRTVKMIPCERNTLTPEFSTCRKFVRGRVNVALLQEINANFRDFNFHYFGPKFSKYFWCCWHLRKRGLLHVSGKLPTYPSLKLTSALASHLGQNVGLGEGKVGSFPWSERGVSYQGGVPSVSLKTEKNSRSGQISSLDLPLSYF